MPFETFNVEIDVTPFRLPADLTTCQVTLVHPNMQDQTFVAQDASNEEGIYFRGPLDPKGLEDGVSHVRLELHTALNKRSFHEFRTSEIKFEVWDEADEALDSEAKEWTPPV